MDIAKTKTAAARMRRAWAPSEQAKASDTRRIAELYEAISKGDVSIASPVKGQMITVSKRTSATPKIPETRGVVSTRRV